MSIESSPSLTDLFEYDEYDSYESSYAEIDTRENLDEGIPLSVELFESISRQCDDVPHKITTSTAATAANDTDDANNQFVRAPEIFLRIDNDVGIASTASATANASTEIKTECIGSAGSIESGGSDVSEVRATGCDIVELHYENEFVDANADECDDGGQMSSCQRSMTQFENDNEQLLFEGTQTNKIICN